MAMHEFLMLKPKMRIPLPTLKYYQILIFCGEFEIATLCGSHAATCDAYSALHRRCHHRHSSLCARMLCLCLYVCVRVCACVCVCACACACASNFDPLNAKLLSNRLKSLNSKLWQIENTRLTFLNRILNLIRLYT